MMGRKMKAIIFHLLPIMFLPKLGASWKMQVQAVPGTFREYDLLHTSPLRKLTCLFGQ